MELLEQEALGYLCAGAILIPLFALAAWLLRVSSRREQKRVSDIQAMWGHWRNIMALNDVGDWMLGPVTEEYEKRKANKQRLDQWREMMLVEWRAEMRRKGYFQ